MGIRAIEWERGRLPKLRWLVALLGVACAVVSIGWARPMWRSAAYHSSLEIFELREGQLGPVFHARKARWKRAEWIPGPEVTLVDERCSACLDEEHSTCAGDIELRWTEFEPSSGGHTVSVDRAFAPVPCRCRCSGRGR